MISLYTQYLERCQGYTLPVDLTAQRLLELITVRDVQGKRMTVTDAMMLNDLASPTTLHRKLDDLLDANLIEQKFEGHNRRTKYLVPTKKAIEHFSKLGLAIAEAGVSA